MQRFRKGPWVVLLGLAVGALAGPSSGPVSAPPREDVLAAMQDELYEALKLTADQKWEEAIPRLEACIRREPTVLVAWESLGWCHWNTDRRGKAVELWRQLLTIDDHHPLPHMLLAFADAHEGRLAEAIGRYRRALSLPIEPRFAGRVYNTKFSLARALRWHGERDESVALLRALAEEDPLRLDVRYELARALGDTGAGDEALSLWASLRASEPESEDFRIGQAMCLVGVGRGDEAMRQVRGILDRDPGNPGALSVLAAAAEYGPHPAEAVPYLRRLAAARADDRVARAATQDRLIGLLVALHTERPLHFGLREAVALARERVAAGDGSETRLQLADLLRMDQQPDAAAREYRRVLGETHPDNVRARRGLILADLDLGRIGDARRELVRLREIDPRDPSLHLLEARIEAAAGAPRAAAAALERLAEAGRRCAIPVLLYPDLGHGVGDGRMPADVFREHMKALADAGYAFLVPEQVAGRLAAAAGDRTAGAADPPASAAVLVTFDNPDSETVALATEAAAGTTARYTLFVPAVQIGYGDLTAANRAALSMAVTSAVWSVGCAVYAGDASRRTHAVPDGSAMTESAEAFSARIGAALRAGRAAVAEVTGGRAPVAFAQASPDPVSDSAARVPGAARIVLHEAAAAPFQLGLVPGGIGYAVAGANPLRISRMPVDRSMTADDLMDTLRAHQPGGDAPRGTGGRDPSRGSGAWSVAPRAPHVRAEASAFRDNQDRRSHHYGVEAGARLSPPLAVSARAGFGRLEQDVPPSAVEPGGPVRYDERYAGGGVAADWPGVARAAAAVTVRDFHAGAGGGPDRSVTAWNASAGFRPLPGLDVALRAEHDQEASAAAVRDGVDYDAGFIAMSYRILDEWDVTAAGVQFRFADDNRREHLSVGTGWRLHDATGLRLGLRYAYADADERSILYWTPYRLHRVYAEASVRAVWQGFACALSLRGGAGRQDARPSTTAPVPEEDWEPVGGGSLRVSRPIAARLTLAGSAAYNRSPDYGETSAGGSLQFQF